MTKKKTLYRDTDDAMIGGVCSGIARYFDTDPTVVRVMFVVTTMLGGGAIVIYMILWWLLETAPAGQWDERLTDAVTP